MKLNKIFFWNVIKYLLKCNTKFVEIALYTYWNSIKFELEYNKLLSKHNKIFTEMVQNIYWNSINFLLKYHKIIAEIALNIVDISKKIFTEMS